jgi:hypothetical protein
MLSKRYLMFRLRSLVANLNGGLQIDYHKHTGSFVSPEWVRNRNSEVQLRPSLHGHHEGKRAIHRIVIVYLMTMAHWWTRCALGHHARQVFAVGSQHAGAGESGGYFSSHPVLSTQ